MKALVVAGIILIVLGIFALWMGEITYTTEKHDVQLGPMEATFKEKKTLVIPPLVGGLVLAGGAALLVLGLSKKK
ncbi:MAG: DUF3185 domain-containing protein [Candidatus Acidiferrales bacterium]